MIFKLYEISSSSRDSTSKVSPGAEPSVSTSGTGFVKWRLINEFALTIGRDSSEFKFYETTSPDGGDPAEKGYKFSCTSLDPN